MKSHVRFIILAFAFLFIAPVASMAQVPALAINEPLVNDYISDNDSPRRASWWNLLGRQLTNGIDKPVDKVSVSELQNVIYFATHHKEKVNLYDAVPSLLDIAQNHEEEGYRIMAVTALHTIGQYNGMKKVRLLLRTEESERVQRVIKATVADYFEL